ncbi:hypothetical protein BD779DRAFT_1474688 [Infundibulicybe gibba]|nr:hypothetical protein BD779DRAFT_1474688 [Infundibulicybe gibba]
MDGHECEMGDAPAQSLLKRICCYVLLFGIEGESMELISTQPQAPLLLNGTIELGPQVWLWIGSIVVVMPRSSSVQNRELDLEFGPRIAYHQFSDLNAFAHFVHYLNLELDLGSSSVETSDLGLNFSPVRGSSSLNFGSELDCGIQKVPGSEMPPHPGGRPIRPVQPPKQTSSNGHMHSQLCLSHPPLTQEPVVEMRRRLRYLFRYYRFALHPADLAPLETTNDGDNQVSDLLHAMDDGSPCVGNEQQDASCPYAHQAPLHPLQVTHHMLAKAWRPLWGGGSMVYIPDRLTTDEPRRYTCICIGHLPFSCASRGQAGLHPVFLPPNALAALLTMSFNMRAVFTYFVVKSENSLVDK